MGREAAEFPELCNHVRLISVPHVEGGLGPVHLIATARIGESRLKSREPAIELWRYPDDFAKQTCHVLSRDSGFESQAFYCDLAAALNHGSCKPWNVHGV